MSGWLVAIGVLGFALIRERQRNRIPWVKAEAVEAIEADPASHLLQYIERRVSMRYAYPGVRVIAGTLPATRR